MSRFAKDGRVFFIEEAIFDPEKAHIDVTEVRPNVFVCVPQVPVVSSPVELSTLDDQVVGLIDKLVDAHQIKEYVAWFYTPMMLGWSRNLRPSAIVYDCMDQLSAFKNAPSELQEKERALFATADLVFTGGKSLFEAKREQHRAVHLFPSSIDAKHFGKAMDIHDDVDEQAEIPHPRVGFVGVIDERSDLELLAAVAEMLPNVDFVMVGPVVKISEDDLPRRSNIHYLGQKSYDELPAILAGWDVAMMPFALNESTRYISPTKTPEYLAAGLPVVSTPIADVVDPYGKLGVVHIASTPEEFAAAISAAMAENADERKGKVAEFLKDLSWDKTFRSMQQLINESIEKKDKQSASVGV